MDWAVDPEASKVTVSPRQISCGFWATVGFVYKLVGGWQGVEQVIVAEKTPVPVLFELKTNVKHPEVFAEVAETTATPEYSKAFYDEQIQKLYTAVGWDPATQSYTGKTQPVKWVRIHNLPDFAYFNHSQELISLSVKNLQYTTSIDNQVNLFFLLNHDNLPDDLTPGTIIYKDADSNVFYVLTQ